MADAAIKHGDFTELAESYAKYRPGYAPEILETFLALSGKSPAELQCADVGAGTGIWSRALAQAGVHVTAVEPNDAMRAQGEALHTGLPIVWLAGSAEKTGLPEESVDLVTMASSFHWPDFEKAVAEFQRILKPGGRFMALWNTRRYESNTLLVRIENKLHQLVPELKRVSSGRSEFCTGLFERLQQTHCFHNVLALEARHVERQSPERYMGLWQSVNDIRVQAGEARFAAFLEYIQRQIADVDVIEAEYATFAWVARRREHLRG